jgi:hypothetical protein
MIKLLFLPQRLLQCSQTERNRSKLGLARKGNALRHFTQIEDDSPEYSGRFPPHELYARVAIARTNPNSGRH